MIKKTANTILVIIIAVIGCNAVPTFASDIKAEISVEKENNLDSCYDNFTIIDKADILATSIDIKGIDSFENVDSIILNPNLKNDEKTVYDTISWEETVKAKIKIGDNCINGEKGKSSFSTVCYIQPDSESSMLPFDGVKFLAQNLCIDGVDTSIGKNNGSVKINYNGKEIIFNENSDKIIIDDTAKDIPNGAYCEKHNGILFIPLRSLSYALDCKVDWVAEGKQVDLERTNKRTSKVQRNVESSVKAAETSFKEKKITDISIDKVDISWYEKELFSEDRKERRVHSVRNLPHNVAKMVYDELCQTLKGNYSIPLSASNIQVVENKDGSVSVLNISGTKSIDSIVYVTYFDVSWKEDGITKKASLGTSRGNRKSEKYKDFYDLPDDVRIYIRKRLLV